MDLKVTSTVSESNARWTWTLKAPPYEALSSPPRSDSDVGDPREAEDLRQDQGGYLPDDGTA